MTKKVKIRSYRELVARIDALEDLSSRYEELVRENGRQVREHFENPLPFVLSLLKEQFAGQGILRKAMRFALRLSNRSAFISRIISRIFKQ